LHIIGIGIKQFQQNLGSGFVEINRNYAKNAKKRGAYLKFNTEYVKISFPNFKGTFGPHPKEKGSEIEMSEIRLDQLNEMVNTDKQAMIARAEERYHELIRSFARRVVSDKNVRIVLLAGPSGSGKTTTANLLCDYVRELSEEAVVVSLDDFYRGRLDPEYPRLPNGERDFEAVEALHLPDLKKTLSDIAANRPFMLPKYDFKVAGRVEEKLHAPIPNGCVIIEGLHALNPMIFEELPKECLLKLFISVSTNVEENGQRILSGRKMRFMRRMVRDNLYRNASAERTIAMWENVLHGEDKYLYPNRKHADVCFDTFHTFELSVMRPFVERLISEELAAREPYCGIVLSAIKKIAPIDISLVPESSLIREFIPGGKYESLY
jgi:uridine kinase